MKTAISIPDSIFQQAEQAARRLGVSRSELYATALRRYLESHRGQAVTEALDELYASEESAVDSSLARMQLASLPREEW